MERTELPIAVFDSGLGGISVLRALVQRLPGEDFLYFGDSANAPYGVRPVAEVRRLTQDVIGRLYDRGIKAAVIACNTATSAAIGPLRAAFPDIPVIGIEPALKPAVAHHRRVLVLATPLTLREEKFVALMHQCAGCAEIVPLPCPELVEFVEPRAHSLPRAAARPVCRPRGCGRARLHALPVRPPGHPRRPRRQCYALRRQRRHRPRNAAPARAPRLGPRR